MKEFIEGMYKAAESMAAAVSAQVTKEAQERMGLVPIPVKVRK